jgi:hypothetical protein
MFGTQRAGPALSGAHARQRGTRVVCQCLARRRPCAMASSALSSATRPGAQGGSTSPALLFLLRRVAHKRHVAPDGQLLHICGGLIGPALAPLRRVDPDQTHPQRRSARHLGLHRVAVDYRGHGRRKALLSLRGRHHPRHATGDDHAHRHEHRQASADRHRDHYPTCGETSAPALVDCFAGRGVRPASSRSPQPATARRSR